MNYIVVREIGKRRYIPYNGIHCGTRNRNEPVLWTTL